MSSYWREGNGIVAREGSQESASRNCSRSIARNSHVRALIVRKGVDRGSALSNRCFAVEEVLMNEEREYSGDCSTTAP